MNGTNFVNDAKKQHAGTSELAIPSKRKVSTAASTRGLRAGVGAINAAKSVPAPGPWCAGRSRQSLPPSQPWPRL